MLQNQKGYSGLHVLLAVTAFVVIAGAGYAVVGKKSSSQPSLSVSGDTQQAELMSALPENVSTVLPIAEIQSKVTLVEGVSIVGIELENEEGKLVYKVKLSDNSVLHFDAISGETVANAPSEVDEDIEDGSIPASLPSTLSLEQIRVIAQSSFPGLTIRKIKLEIEHGTMVYSIRYTDGSRLDLNAIDGSVVRAEQEKSEIGESHSESNDDSSPSSDQSSGNDRSENENENENEDHESSTSNSSSTSTSQSQAAISLEAARAIALAQKPGTIQTTETEKEDGVTVYSFRYTNGGRIDVRASDGAIIKSE